MRDALSLAAWEVAAEQRPPPERALALLGLVRPDVPPAEGALWSVGRRNAALLTARLNLFGTEVTAVAHCPGCASPVEATFDGRALQRESSGEAAPLVAEALGWRIALRPLQTADLIAVAGERLGVQETARRLLKRCITEIGSPPGANPEPDAWPEECAQAVADALREADPLAETSLALTCPECGHAWESDFDIPEFLLTELAAHGERVMDDIHHLATRYGWTEPDILAIPPARRAAFCERAG